MISRAAILLFCMFTLLGCKKNNVVSPDTTPPPTPVTAVVIGAAGGDLTAGDFRLTVPQGAFAQQETLKVQAVTYDNSFGSRNISQVFKLEGLPADFAQPLELRIKQTRAPANGQFIVMGSEGVGARAETRGIGYSPLSATVDSGYLRATIPPTGSAAQGSSMGKSGRASTDAASLRWLFGVDDMETMQSSDNHFRFLYPRYLAGQVAKLSACLEQVLSVLPQYGFDVTGGDFRIMYPVPVLVLYLPAMSEELIGDVFLGSSSNFGPWAWLIFNESALAAADNRTLAMTAGELGTLLLCVAHNSEFAIHVEEGRLSVYSQAYWPYFSIMSFMGELFAPVGSGESYPLNFPSYQMQPLSGLNTVPGEYPSGHGIGFSALLKYLAVANSSSFISEMFNAVKNHGMGVEAVLSTVSQSEQEWWPGFLSEYISGEIYPVKSGGFLKELSSPGAPGVFTVAGKTDTLKKFSDSYPDLSAKLYRVNLEYPGIDTSSTIRFAVGPSSLNYKDVGVILFGFKDSTLTYWQYGNTVNVSAVRDLTLAGYDILAAVVNCLKTYPFRGSQTIELTVSVETKQDVGPGPASAYLEATVAGTETNNYSGSEQSGSGIWMGESGWRQGTFTNGEFNGTWSISQPDPYGGSSTDIGQMTITLKGSAPPAEVSSIYFSRIIQSAGGREEWQLTSSAACNIPAYWENGAYVYRISGTDVTNHLDIVLNEYRPEGDLWRSFSDPRADAANKIELKIVLGQ